MRYYDSLKFNWSAEWALQPVLVIDAVETDLRPAALTLTDESLMSMYDEIGRQAAAQEPESLLQNYRRQ